MLVECPKKMFSHAFPSPALTIECGTSQEMLTKILSYFVLITLTLKSVEYICFTFVFNLDILPSVEVAQPAQIVKHHSNRLIHVRTSYLKDGTTVEYRGKILRDQQGRPVSLVSMFLYIDLWNQPLQTKVRNIA